jgi:hypothetical protein
MATVAGEWMRYTRTFPLAGSYDIYLNAAYKGTTAATLGLDFYTPGTTTSIKGVCN